MADEEAKKVLEANDPLDGHRRAVECAKKIDELLKEYRCVFDVEVTFSRHKGMMPRISVQPIMVMPDPASLTRLPNDPSRNN